MSSPKRPPGSAGDVPKDARPAAQLRLLAGPRELFTGAGEEMRLRIRNDGARPWSTVGENAVHVSYHWLTAGGSTVVFDGLRTPLPASVQPGMACEVDVRVVPPNTTGDFLLELDLVRGKNDWFAAHGSPVLRLPCPVRRGVMEDFGDYLAAWDRVDLAKDWWSIVGPATPDEFEALGRHKLELLNARGLRPDSRVLDVGCGTGCLTRMLVDYLGPDGVYCGTDIAPQAIEFCRARYARPGFLFLVNGRTEVVVPGESFDLVALFSVFTHMYPDEIRAMLQSFRALLRPGGAVVADAFVVEQGPPFVGSRAKVDVAEAALTRAFAQAGFRLQPTELLGREGDVRRLLYWLQPREPVCAPD